MVKCIVPGCCMSNNIKKKKNNLQKLLEQNIKISLHKLPKDAKKRRLWLQNIGLDENINLKSSASICSLHFKEEHINRTLDKICLHENAIPYADAFIDDTYKQENIKNDQDYLNLSLSSIDDENQSSYLKTVSNETSVTKINIENEEYNQEKSVSIQAEKQIFLDECTGELNIEQKSIQAGITQQCTVLYEKYLDEYVYSKNLCENLNLKIDRSTSVSPQHFQNDTNLNSKVNCSTSVSPQHFQNDSENDSENVIKYLKASFQEYKRQSQRTIRSLKRKLKRKRKQKKSDLDVMTSLKSKFNQNHLHVLEQIDKSNKELLKRMILKREMKTINKQYSPELRDFALTLHYYSPKAYNYVREKFEYVLPHPKTLYKWYISVEENPGFNAEALQ